MKELLTRAGIDVRQYRALFKLAWRVDMRANRMGFGLRRKGRRPLLTFLVTIFFYLMLGGIFAQFSYTANDTFLSATFTIGGIMFMLGGLMMVEYNTIVISPDDFQILGFHPVSSRTYFLAKITNVLIYIVAFSTVLGGPTILAHALKGGFGFSRLFLGSAAIFGAAFFVSLGVVVLYGTLLRLLSPATLRSAITYIQFAISLVVYAGYIILPDLLEQHALGITIEKSGWLLLIPTTWFACLLELGHGAFTPFDLAGGLLAVGMLLFLLRATFSRLSLDYAKRIAMLSEHTGDKKKISAGRSTGGLGWLRFLQKRESRVVARLIYCQFKYDTKFKIAVLGVVPLLVMYFFMGLREGQLPDPFLETGDSLGQFFVFFFALLMIPMIMKQNLETSDTFQAAWIFYAAPARIEELILATRNVLFVLFSLPCLLFMFFVFGYYFGDWLHAFLHTITITALSFLFLQVVYLVRPGLPFAEPKTRGRRSLAFSVLFFILPAIGLLFLHLIALYFYASLFRLIIAYAGFVGVVVGVEQFIRFRVRRLSHNLQFVE